MERRPARLAVTIIALLTLSLLGPSPILQEDSYNENRETVKNSSCVVCINELMPNADGSDQGIFPQGEWIELLNTGSSSVNLEGWTIVDIGGWSHPINENSWIGFADLLTPYHLEAGAYAVIAENEIGTLRLNNAGETVFLKDSQDVVVHEITTGQAANGVSKIPSGSNAEWVDSDQPTPGAVNSGGEPVSDPDPPTPNDLTRIMMVPDGAEVTGLHVNSIGNLFVSAMHPDDPYKATIGVVNGFDWNELPETIPELPSTISQSEIWHGIRTSVGTYQVLLQSGDSLSSGEVAGGIYAADDGALLFTSEKPDFNVFVPTNSEGTEGYLYSTWESRPAGVSQLHIEWNDMSGEWDTIGGKMLDLSGINGGWVLCFGSLSPWDTPLLSEELYFEDTIDWNNPNYNYHQDQLELADYLGFYPNPYDYGWIIEVEDADTVNPQFERLYPLGRFSHENAQVMPDRKTVYLSDDEYGTVLFKFIADSAGDLHSGTLYAAKVNQDSGTNPATTGFDVTWVELGHSNSAQITSWIDQYDGIDSSDFVNGQNSYISDQEINDWAEHRLDDDLDGDGNIGFAADNRVAFLESRKAAAALGATDEWNKMEGVVFNENSPEYLYLAMSDIRYDMTDSSGDIQLSENRCGIIYSLPVDEQWGVSRIEPVEAGGSYSSGRCDVNRIAGPDNLAVLNDGSLLIAEDTGKHENNMLWHWQPPAGPSDWDNEYDVKFTRIMPGEVPNRDNDWFELTNTGDEEISLTGWTIERIRSTTPWISTFNELVIPAGASVVLTENQNNLLSDGGIVAMDGNVVMNNMPWLVDSGSALQLKSPDGTVVDAVVYGGGDAEIEGWNGAAISVPGDGTPGLILMRGSGCGDNPDTDTGEDWEYRWIRIGASTFCDGGKITLEESSTVTSSIGPDTSFNDLMHWIENAETSIHLHVYQFMSPDLTNALLDAINRGVSVTILLEEGILDGSSTKNNQRGHAQTLHDAGATVLWMEDPSLISSPYTYIHSKVAVRDTESVWISSGNWKDTSLPPDGIGNREWSVIVNSISFAELVMSRLSWDENENHLHISPHSSNHAPTSDWVMDETSGVSLQAPTTQPYSGPLEMQLMTCPDDCVDGIIEMIDAADSTIELSLQYLDLDWYWGFGDNPIIEAIYQAAQRGVQVRLLLNGFYADSDDEIRDAVNLFNTNWNATEGLDTTARLMAYSDSITKLHNKGAIIDGESVLVGSMNWGSNAALRNREMSVLIHDQELTSEYLQSFNEDWHRLDSNTDSDGDLLPDMWEIQYGLNRHSAAVLGTALSEQSLDLDEDGLNNLNEYLWGGNPNDNDTDDDCILDGQEAEFAQSLGRSPIVAMNSSDVDGNGIPDGIQFGCDEEEIIDNNNGQTNNTDGSDGENNDEGNGGWLENNVRDDPLSTPGAKFLFALTIIAATFLVAAGLTMVRRPRIKSDSRLIDDSGYRFDDADAEQAILKGTRFDEGSEDTRDWTEGRDDGVHGQIVLDGFGFDKLDRNQVQFLLDKGMSIEELRDEYGEDEA